jgi:putative ABC transport system permease protein
MSGGPMSGGPSGGWGLALRFARRELRGGVRGFRVFLACLALGAFAIAAAGSTRTAVEAALAADAQGLLGGDLLLRQTYRVLTEDQRAALTAHGRLSESREMRAMARAGDRQALVELKAVDAAYPLYGALRLAPDRPLGSALARDADGRWGAVAEPALVDRLGLAVGDTLRLGEATLVLTAVIAHEPDRVASVVSFGPRLMVGEAALADTGLLQPGSLVHGISRLRVTDGTDPGALGQSLLVRFPDAAFQMRTTEDAAPGLQRFLGDIALFLTLVGLTALLVGGIGVANAVRAYVDGRARTIAVLKMLGAPAAMVFRIYLLQIGALALLGVAVGVAAGALAPWALSGVLAGLLPVAVGGGPYLRPLVEATAFGLLTALVFGLWPLSRTRGIPAAALFRAAAQSGLPPPRGAVVLAIAVGALALAGLTVATADRPGVALGFVLGALAALAVFRLAAHGLTRLARAATARPGVRVGWRLALANLHRPGAPTASVVLSLGLGLSVLVTVALIEANLNRQIGERMPEDAPAFFYIDIQPAQRAPFRAAVAGVAGAKVVRMADMIRGRIVALNGRPVDEASVDPDVRWAVRGDRGLTTAATPPPGALLTQGEWWPADYTGPPLFSVAAGIAHGLGLGLGDTVTVNVLGRTITGTVANLREVDWATLSMNFAFVASPGALSAAPRTWIATVAAPPGREAAIERAVTAVAPNASAIRVREALATVQGVLEAAGQAVRATAAITLVAGGLVLAGAIAAGHRRRIYDAVVLKVLGARRGDILRAYLIEYGLMGLATGLLAAATGTLAAWAVLAQVMHADWAWMPGVTAAVLTTCVALTLAGGFLGTWRALAHKASPWLRDD